MDRPMRTKDRRPEATKRRTVLVVTRRAAATSLMVMNCALAAWAMVSRSAGEGWSSSAANWVIQLGRSDLVGVAAGSLGVGSEEAGWAGVEERLRFIWQLWANENRVSTA